MFLPLYAGVLHLQIQHMVDAVGEEHKQRRENSKTYIDESSVEQLLLLPLLVITLGGVFENVFVGLRVGGIFESHNMFNADSYYINRGANCF